MLRFGFAVRAWMIVAAFGSVTVLAQQPESTVEGEADAAAAESELLQGTRQITFQGQRAGEGYFSGDGTAWFFRASEIRRIPFIKST